MTRKVAVTGARGFIGRNLTVRLSEKNFDVVPVPHSASASEMAEALSGVEAVLHCAGVNRPETEEEFFSGNAGMTERLCVALRSLAENIPVAYTSSIHAAQNTPYGLSKREAEDALLRYREENSAPVTVFRLPNVFGKWARPNYNSAIATFCYNIARDVPIHVHDPDAPLELVYIDDVCERFLEFLDDPSGFQNFGEVTPVYHTTVGEVAGFLQEFRSSRTTLKPGAVGAGLMRALYATYLSYLPSEDFSYPLKAHEDPRGVFAEIIRTPDSGQFSFFTAHPGVTRGAHYHHTKNEKFVVVRGHARFRFRHLVTDEVFEMFAEGRDPQVVESIPGWAHDVTNVGEEEMVVLLWANETFDPERPDTIAARVGK